MIPPVTALAAQLGRALAAHRGDRARAELAATAGVTDQALRYLEEAKANPTLERIERTAELYGITLAVVDVDALLEELDTILRGKFGAAPVPRRNALARIRQHITQENPTP